MKKYSFFTLLFFTISCADKGYLYSPVMLEMETPEGSAELKAGWHAGCGTGQALKYFNGGFVYDIDAGNGVYQHDPVFQGAWANAYQACRIHNMNFPKPDTWKTGAFEGKWGALR